MDREVDGLEGGGLEELSRLVGSDISVVMRKRAEEGYGFSNVRS
jgi:hypothetical protein